MDTNEITINRIVGFQWDEPGTDVEDELPTPTSSLAQNVAPVIPLTETADSVDRGDGFALDLVLLDISVMPALISPIEESVVPPTSEAAEYAAPEAPVLETMIESPGYAVPGKLTISWVPGYVPVPVVTTMSEEGQMLSTGHPPLKTFLASAATPVVTPESMDQFLPTMPSPPEDILPVAETESVRETDKTEVFVVDAAEGSPSTAMCQGRPRLRSRLDKGGTFRWVRGPTRTRPVATGLEQYAGMSMPGCQ